MKFTFLGTGTSVGVPMVGCTCEVCLSDKPKDKRLRCSLLVEMDDGFTFVIDTGPDFRYQMLRAKVKRLDAVLITHDHKDHTGGLDDVRAFNFLQKRAMEVYATEASQTSIKRSFDYIFAEHKYPGVPNITFETIDDQPFMLNGLEIIPIQVMHHKMPVTGFRIGDFTYITDANYIAEKELEKVKGSKVLVLNALRFDSHISHFTLGEATSLAQQLDCEETWFTHISHQLGQHDDINPKLPAKIRLAYDGLSLDL